MFVRDDQVGDWRDLQQRVATLFTEMGYHAELARVIELAGRGKKEIDVYVEDRRASVPTRILIECKWWDSAVKQEVVHSFHTVVSGVGANYGFIVSKKGFQSGAMDAIANTPITLLTFELLQHQYGGEWFRVQRANIDKLAIPVREAAHLHFDQWNPIMCAVNNRVFWSTEFAERFLEAHAECVRLVCQLGSRWPESYRGPEPVLMATDPLDPLRDPAAGTWHTVASVREYFARLGEGLTKWTRKFEALRTEARAKAETDPELEVEQMLQTLAAAQEEMPIRVLKRHLSNEEYQKLLDLVKRNS